MPMICYAHPNGQHSNLKYPVIFCGSSEHTAMLIAGSLLLAIGACFQGGASKSELGRASFCISNIINLVEPV